MEKYDKKAIEHLKELLGASYVKIVKNFSTNLTYKKKVEMLDPEEWNNANLIMDYRQSNELSPFYNMHYICIVEIEDKISLISYTSFMMDDNDNLSFMKENVSYIFKDMDHHVFTNGHYYDLGGWRQSYINDSDAFIKDNTLYGITYSNGIIKKKEIEGKIYTDTKGCATFLTTQGNTLYEHEIVTGEYDTFGNYISYTNILELKSRLLHRDTKEISDIKCVNTKYKNDGYITSPPDVDAIIVSFVDGTKRLIVKNASGKKSSSRYFKNLELTEAVVMISKKEFKKEPEENKYSWNNDGCGNYYIPGLSFNYTTDNTQGEFIVKNNGHMSTPSRKRINQSKKTS